MLFPDLMFFISNQINYMYQEEIGKQNIYHQDRQEIFRDKSKGNISKRWSQQEKKLFIEIYKKYPNDWQKISNFFPERSIDACIGMGYKLKLTKKRKAPNLFCRFTPSEDQMILQLYKIYPEKWDIITQHLRDRKIPSVYNRYRYLNKISLPMVSRIWKTEQDQLFFKLVDQLQYNWNQIANHFQDCTGSDCYTRYKYMIGVNQWGGWSSQQQKILLELFEKYKENWNQISRGLEKKRTAASCKHRFHILKGFNIKTAWKVEEIEKLIQLYDQKSGEWQEIQKSLPKFSIRQCYFRYYHQIQQSNKKNSIRKITRKNKRSQNQRNQYHNYWNFQDDDLLLQLAIDHSQQWQLISNLFPKKRSSANCKSRYLALQKIYNTVSNRIWTEQDDRKLILYISSNRMNVGHICRNLNNCSKQECYLRYQQLMKIYPEIRQQMFKNERNQLQQNRNKVSKNSQQNKLGSYEEIIYSKFIEQVLEEINMLMNMINRQ